MRRVSLVLSGLLLLAGVWVFWPSQSRQAVTVTPAKPVARVIAQPAPPANPTAAARPLPGQNPAVKRSVASVTRERYRLANTAKNIKELSHTPHAVLLENALVDTDVKTALNIPKPLRAEGDPGAYIVQARGTVNGAFRSAVTAAGAKIISYIPNNAFLVQMNAAGAGALGGNPLVQAVLPYQPYYKVQASLLAMAIKQQPLPSDMGLTLGLFPDGAENTVAQLKQLGAQVVGFDRSPFGPVVRVIPPVDWVAIARLPGVQQVEPSRQRLTANDLSRVTMGVSLDSVVTTNYLNLDGNNVLVEVNDTGIDPNPKVFQGRVSLDNAGSGLDTDGHGTFVAGEIAGDNSTAPLNAQGSVTNASFRGMAPAARLFSVGGIGKHNGAGLYNYADRVVLGGNDTNSFTYPTNFFLPGAAIYLPFVSDYTFTPGAFPDWYFQEAAAITNALISNNSWNRGGAADYDLSAASYDAAVRDALPEITGPQPVLFVFSAGNDGGGNSGGTGGVSDTILSPATAKNVITVGALEQARGITNTYEPFGTTNPSSAWFNESDSSSQVAGYSSRGNVGIGTEGKYGRFKPDVVAPGSFVISTRSRDWNTNAYYNPTNYTYNTQNAGQVVDTNYFNIYTLTVPTNTIGIVLRVEPNNLSPSPFPPLAFYVTANNLAGLDPSTPGTYDFSATNAVTIPPDGTLANYVNNGSISFAITDYTNSIPVDYDLVEELITTNDNGTYNADLQKLNDSLGSDYRYESGTSMAAANVSGMLALMQDFFVNTLHQTPSPALLKALLINGARIFGNYSYSVEGPVNDEGWGLVNLPDSIPAGLAGFNPATGGGSPLFFVDQSPTNALATGDRRSYNVQIPGASSGVPLRVTLVWTDPPGNPAAALKLVNNLDLIVSNNVTGDYYVGNVFNQTDPSVSQKFVAANTNSTPVFDTVNNVENVVVPGGAGTNYTVTVVGRDVNVNAVTTEQTNIVQDFALVVSAVDLGATNDLTVTPAPSASVPTPLVTGIGATNGIQFNQLAGASAPWLSANYLPIAPAQGFGTNAAFYPGQTNQWHFYAVTNTTPYTNAAFITFIPNTLAIPREGVFAGSQANSTRPEADLDLFVAPAAADPQASGLTNLDPVVISNCIYGAYGPNGDQAALERGGTKFLVYSNSTQNGVYYVGVKCEDQMAGEYGFLAVFTDNSFSHTDTNGNVYVNGLNVPVAIPDGDNQHPGVAYIVSLALPTDPTMTLRNVIVSNTVTHENFGDLIGQLSHNNAYATLNNHDDVGPVNQTFIYNDGSTNETPGSQLSAGPGTLGNFQTKAGLGLWIMNEIDDHLTQTGRVDNFQMKLEPHKARNGQLTEVIVPAHGWYYDYVDVPVGYTNMLVVATNTTDPATLALNPPVQLYLNDNGNPTQSNYLAEADLNLGTPPGNSISYGPPIMPGTYYLGLYNPSGVSQTVLLGVTLAFNPAAISHVNWTSAGPVPLLDDAVTDTYQFVTNQDIIQGISIGLRVDHPRISDLSFTLISPNGDRYLLMENRGGQSTAGCGVTVLTTNLLNVSHNGSTNIDIKTLSLPNGQTSGTLPITYNFYQQPDQMTVYYGTNIASTNDLILNTGMTNNPVDPLNPSTTLPVTVTVAFPPSTATGTYTNLTIVMNQYGNPSTNGGDLWIYTAGSVSTNNYYLSFTENTNLTTTPIKYAVPPFVPVPQTNGTMTNLFYQPEQSLDPLLGTSAYGNWTLEILDNRIGATNNANLVSWQLQFTFANTNLPPVPPVVTQPASNITTTNARLNALVYPGGDTNTTLYFEYGTNLVSTAGGTNLVDLNVSDPLLLTSNLTSQLPYGIMVTNLAPEMLYYFQAYTVDSTGTTNYGGWLQFISHIGLPYAATLPATRITGTSAQLNGFASPNGLSSMAWFEWGTNTAYGNVTPAVNVGAGNSVVYMNALITGLITNTTYHCRLVVSNVNAVVYGYDQAFGAAHVVGWGANYLGQVNVPAGLTNAVAIAGAYDHSMAITTNGQVVAWGDNTVGQTNVPGSVSNSVAAAGGETYSLALGADGTVAAWGSDFYPGAGETNVPAGLSNVVMISSGRYSSLALRSDGTVVGWGADLFNPTNLPAGLSNIVAIASGTLHSLALRNDGTVMAWGNNGAGQTNVPAGLSNVVAIAAGAYHSLALRGDGTVVAWGYNNDGQTNVPAGLTNVTAIAAGGYHSMALKSDGSLVMWGDNSAGQQSLPYGVTNFVAIAAGYLQSLALTPQTIINLTNVVVNFPPGAPQTNNILPGGVTFYQVNVPANADAATNTLLFAHNGRLNVWFTTNGTPSIGGANDTLLMGGVTNGVSILTTNGTPPLVPGSTYYLGVQNTNSVTVNYAIEVNFHLTTTTNPPVTPPTISSIIYTNGGFLLTWYAPSNDLFQVQCSTNLVPANWITFTNPPYVSYNTNAFTSPTNTQFNFFDDGSQVPFGPTRFYRLILLQATNTLTLPAQTNFSVSAGAPVTVTNTATDSNPSAVLTYSLVNPPAGASIDTNGIITWTNAGPAGLAARFDTLVTDNGLPPASATNSFTVFVTPLPAITNVLVTATNVTLSWTAPTNDQFQVQWTTNLVSPVTWTYLPSDLAPATITSATGVFSYTDTNAPAIMKFYQLILLP